MATKYYENRYLKIISLFAMSIFFRKYDIVDHQEDDRFIRTVLCRYIFIKLAFYIEKCIFNAVTVTSKPNLSTKFYDYVHR